MHLDREAAARSPSGGLIVCGWFTPALVMRLIAESRPFGDTEVLGMGVENLRWRLPMRPGDRLYPEMEVVWVALSESNPVFGIVKFMVIAESKWRGGHEALPICWVPRRLGGWVESTH